MSHGGKRVNAGRPRGTGPHKEPTKPIRIPVSLIGSIEKYIASKGYAVPLFSSRVQAGFPSPADDHQERNLDLNEHLIKNPAATFYVHATGHSMINAGINSGDLLIVDKSVTPASGKIVIAIVDGEFTVKRLIKKNGRITLQAENPDYPSIEIKDENDLQIWGVVTNVIREL